MRAIVLAVFVGAVCAIVMLALLQRLGGALIRASIFLSIGVKAAVGAAFLANGLVAPGVTLLLMALATAAYYTCIRSRVRFAAAHVHLAALALRGAPDLIFLNITLLLSQGIWSILWGLAALGVEYAVNNQGGGGQGAPAAGDSDKGLAGTVAVFALLLSYFWVSGTIHNIASFCAASVLGDWWWKGAREARPVRGALTRAFTTSFGTIALGAFLVALCTVLKSLRRLAERKAAERAGGNSGARLALAVACCLLGCVLNIVSAIAEWANQWAIVYAALTGLDFRASGLAAVELFRKRGWGALVNQDLVGAALFLASFVSASVGALAGGLLAYNLDGTADASSKFTHASLAALLSFFVAMLMASVLTEIISTATRAVFVAWATDPAALAATHPEELKELAIAWHECHPALLEDSGYRAALQATIPVGLAPPPPAAQQQAPYGGSAASGAPQQQQHYPPPPRRRRRAATSRAPRRSRPTTTLCECAKKKKTRTPLCSSSAAK